LKRKNKKLPNAEKLSEVFKRKNLRKCRQAIGVPTAFLSAGGCYRNTFAFRARRHGGRILRVKLPIYLSLRRRTQVAGHAHRRDFMPSIMHIGIFLSKKMAGNVFFL